MRTPDRVPAQGGSFVNVVLARMRRRTARVGLLVVLLFALIAGLAFFAVCACQSFR